MRVLDLFSGIGGFSLGLERAGMKTVAFCEINPFCRRVLAKHWPGVRCYDDVRSLSAERLHADGIPVDVICGGFPCQDISLAGKGAGLAGERSGLWREYARLVGELRPRFVIVENVSALLGRGLGEVLGDLASLGFDAEWNCIPAAAVGAGHLRDRVWLVAYPSGERRQPYDLNVDLSTTSRARQHSRNVPPISWNWEREPIVGRVVSRLPYRVDRLTALGNAVVPQIPEMIGRPIMESV